MSPTILVIDKSLFTEPLTISVSGLPIKAAIKLKAELKDNHQRPWFVSEATYISDDEGKIDLSVQAPISGSYQGIDPMGLFWSMQPVDKTEKFYVTQGNENEIFLSVMIENKSVATKTIQRYFAKDNVITKEVKEAGLVGYFCYPKDAAFLPGIITLSGSGGGMSLPLAQIFASYGYPCLALGYFGVPGLPDYLENIPLEYFQKAIYWFKSQPQVNGNKVALRGASYGGLLVLLLATTFPDEFSAVVAISPPSYIFGGFPHSNLPMWTYKNKPLEPFISGLTSKNQNLTEQDDLLRASREKLIPSHHGTLQDPFEISPLFSERLKKHKDILESATIPVEKIKCPLLLISGDDDKIHPATFYSKLIMERLEKFKSPIEREHLSFPKTGHSIRTPYEPKEDMPWKLAENVWASSGGTVEGNAHASKKSWEEMMSFLSIFLD